MLRPRGTNLHYEVELGLVMGKSVKDLDPEDNKGAMDAIKSALFPLQSFPITPKIMVETNIEPGYLLTIDMTARNVQDEAKKKGLPWTIAKGFDTFLPVSEEIAKSRIPDPHNAFLRLSVGSQLRQADSSGLMLYRIPRLMAEISRVMTLQEGDLVLTGTPKGVGQVHPGDVMRGSLEVDGKELEESKIDVGVEEREGRYVYSET